MLIVVVIERCETGWNDMITGRTNEIVSGSAAAAAALVGGLLTLQPALGQDSGTVTVDVGHCVELESAAARRACFGAQVDELLEARGSVESDNPSNVSEDIEADRNLRTEDEAPSEPERGIQGATEARVIDESRESAEDGAHFGTITAMQERLPFSYVITLDNGQMWEQVEPKRYPLRPGLEVRIYPTRWGERYRLSGVGAGGHIQVRRVR